MSIVEKLKKRGGFWINYSCSGTLGLEKRFSDKKPSEKTGSLLERLRRSTVK